MIVSCPERWRSLYLALCLNATGDETGTMTHRYAASTDVDVDRSRAEIERTLRRFGCEEFGYSWTPDGYRIGFRIKNRLVRYDLPLPRPEDRQFTRTPARGLERTPAAAQAAYDQAVKQRFRALLLVIKAKLEAVESGITTLEDEFLAHTVIPGTKVTVGEWIRDEVPNLGPGRPIPALPSG